MRNVNIPVVALIPVMALALLAFIVTGYTTLDVAADASPATPTFARNPVNLDLAGWLPSVKPATAKVQTPPIHVLRQWGMNLVGFLESKIGSDYCFLKSYKFLPIGKSSQLNSSPT